MKAERLLAILTIFPNRKKISASALARELEVSLRTAYRDIDALAEAGIPVFATAGRTGRFELVKTLLWAINSLRQAKSAKFLPVFSFFPQSTRGKK